MSFAKTLKKLRKKAKMTRYFLARESGDNATYLARLESGAKVHPGRHLVLRIGQALLDNSGNCVPCSSHFGFGLGGLNLTQPEFLRQGVNYLGFLTQQLGPLRGIATLLHELIQNADDAKDESGKLAATGIIFDIRDDAWEVTNDGYFLESDFDGLQDVANANKRFRPGAPTTGAFGVGFISVYQVTGRRGVF